MIKTLVRINFASPEIKMSQEDYKFLCEAVTHASHNLRMKHDVIIHQPILVDDEFDRYCTIELEIPEEQINNFNIGIHLKGIAGYLLKRYPDKFRPYLMGSRLFLYKEQRDSYKAIKSYSDWLKEYGPTQEARRNYLHAKRMFLENYALDLYKKGYAIIDVCNIMDLPPESVMLVLSKNNVKFDVSEEESNRLRKWEKRYR